MISMRQLRSDPYYAPLFRHVHPLCWWILWWSLNRFFRWYDTSGYENLLLATTRWGYVYPAYLGEKKPDPSAWKPYAPERPRWDDPAWAMRVPAPLLTLAACETLRSGGLRGSEIALRFPEQGSWLSLWRGRETEGACTLTFLDTS